MPSLKQITRKISSVKGTRRIMSAMKLIAAVKLQRSQALLNAYRPYSDAYKNITLNIASKSDPKHHSLLRKPVEIRKTHLVFLTSDRGLCGNFNSSLLRSLGLHLDSCKSDNKEVKVSFIGRRGKDSGVCQSRGLGIGDYFSGADEKNYTGIAKEMANSLIGEFQNEEIDEVIIVYNYFKSALTQEITFERVLPIDSDSGEDHNSQSSEYIYEPTREKILGDLIPKYVQVRIERAIQESLTSEHASRMTAMENATSNADDVIKKLTLLFNKTRQAMITTELMDIVNGTEAQKQGGND